MEYVLKNKDRDVLRFGVEDSEETFAIGGKEVSSKITSVNIYDSSLMPINLNTDDIQTSLASWIVHRKIPKNRALIDNIVATYSSDHKESLMEYVNVSLALSLNDSYWIVPAGSNYQWKDYNLYHNEFSKALELVAFGVQDYKVSGIETSPEYTTNGMLKKCWHRENGNIYLYKGSSHPYANSGREAFSEYYMAQVAQVMGFECVSYDLVKFHNQIVSACPIFTNENEGYVPIYYTLNKDERNTQGLRLINALANVYGKESLENLLLFDSVICNEDRHLGNFGMIIDNNTNTLLRPAPIFDNGMSIINTIMESETKDIQAIYGTKTSYFGLNFERQMDISAQKRHLPALENLSKFDFVRHPHCNVADSILEPINVYIKQRALKAIEMIRGRKKSITKSKDLPKQPKPKPRKR